MIVVTACVGLRHYRIDNDLRRWMPDIAGDDNLAGMLIVGYDPQLEDGQELAANLQAHTPAKAIIPFAGDGRLAGLLILPDAHVTGAQLLTAVRSELSGRPSVHPLAGPAVFAQAIDDWSQRGLSLASGLLLLCGAVAVYLTTRSVAATSQSLVAIFSSQLVLMGWISWCQQPMDMMLSMLPPLMMALGFSYAAHRAMRADASLAMVLSMVTSAAGLLTFALTDFASIRSFALWGALGVGLTWAAVMLLVRPASDASSSGEELEPGEGFDNPPLRSWQMKHAWLLTLAGLSLTAAGFVLCMNLKVESDVLRYFPASAKIVQDYRLLNDQLTGMLPFEVQIVEPAGSNPERLAEALTMLRSTPGVRLVIPIATSIDTHHQHYLGMADNAALTSLSAAQPDWQAWAKTHDVTLKWQGVAAQLDHIGRSVIHTAMTAVPAMIIISGLAAWVIDRRLRSVLLSMYVNVFPVACLVLIAWGMGHPMGLATLVIFSLAIGMAVDDTLHLIVAAKKSGSMALATRLCFRPCLGSSLAVAICMAMFGFCAFKPTAEFGLLVAIVTLFASAGDLILLPAAASLLEKYLPSQQVNSINQDS